MLIVHSQDGVPIRLTDERWQHIVSRHPEMVDQREQVVETVADPEMIQEGDFGALLAVRSLLPSKFLVVAYRETSTEDGFVLTAYLTTHPSTRRAIKWKR